MPPLVTQDGSVEQLDSIADVVADVLGGFNRRTAALRLLLKKVRDRWDRDDSDARKYLDAHSLTPED